MPAPQVFLPTEPFPQPCAESSDAKLEVSILRTQRPATCSMLSSIKTYWVGLCHKG